MRHSAKTVQDELQSRGQPEAVDADLRQQQQRVIDVLQLRSDELSAENGKLRMQMAMADQKLIGTLQNGYISEQLPWQLHNDCNPSRVALPVQQPAAETGLMSAGTAATLDGVAYAAQAPYAYRWGPEPTHHTIQRLNVTMGQTKA